MHVPEKGLTFSEIKILQYAKLEKNQLFHRCFSIILISSAEQLCKTLLDGCFLQLRNNTGSKIR